MLAPEVWDLRIRDNIPRYDIRRGTVSSQIGKMQQIIQPFEAVTQISLILPDNSTVPESFRILMHQSIYYTVNKIQPFDLLEPDFIEAFVKRGCISAIGMSKSREGFIINNNGKIIINMTKETFQYSGITASKVRHHRITDNHLYELELDLRAEDNYALIENVRNKLKRINMFCNMEIKWNVDDSTVCATSVASYFEERGFTVTRNQPEYSVRQEYDVDLPEVKFDAEDLRDLACDVMIAQEYVDILTMNCDINKASTSDSVAVGSAKVVIGKGFFTEENLVVLAHELSQIIKDRNHLPWASITYQQTFVQEMFAPRIKSLLLLISPKLQFVTIHNF